MEQEGEVGRAIGGHAVVFEPWVFARRLAGFPAVAEGRVGDHGVECRFLRGVGLAEPVPGVGQRVAMVNLELGVLLPVEQLVHPSQVVGGDVVLLAVDFADRTALRLQAATNVEQ